MRPNKVHGLTDAERARRCIGKQRWADEMAARAGAIYAIETFRKADKLWVYRCPHCYGWHLTRTRQVGQEPVRLQTDKGETSCC